MSHVEDQTAYSTGSDGHENHLLLHRRVRDTASHGEGVLTAVTQELRDDGRVVRIAHIRPETGIEWTVSADNIQAAHESLRTSRRPLTVRKGNLLTTAEKPWGLERLAPYALTVPVPYARIEIDPVTQTTCYLGADGRSIDMGEHGTNTATATATATGADGGGTRPPQPADTDALEDHASD
ncbi:putative ATP-grasp-modified RiPP [Streptomyces sp. NPDC101490]|uniref:putative ATP-grasp-modified RiPP n=1 Tax=Streptomyces sp. NPDC101490 TaxID=3366143 RepID=UPI00381B9A8F